jgi:hypothetical protein
MATFARRSAISSFFGRWCGREPLEGFTPRAFGDSVGDAESAAHQMAAFGDQSPEYSVSFSPVFAHFFPKAAFFSGTFFSLYACREMKRRMESPSPYLPRKRVFVVDRDKSIMDTFR